jgi:adenylate kinase
VKKSTLAISSEEATLRAISNSPPSLIIIRGLPGSGKSTLAKKFVCHGYRHVESDMYFYFRGKYRFKILLLPKAHLWAQNSVKFLLRTECLVVVSNTFTTLSEMSPYTALTDSHVIIELSPKNSSTHGVPVNVFNNMQKRWEPI